MSKSRRDPCGPSTKTPGNSYDDPGPLATGFIHRCVFIRLDPPVLSNPLISPSEGMSFVQAVL